MRRLLLIGALLCLISATRAQTGTWHSYRACYNTTAVSEGDSYVYALADGALYTYGKDDNAIRTYSKVNGMNDVDILSIAYHAPSKTLVAVYSNGNIDLIGDDMSIYNLPFLMTAENIQDKTVNGIYCDGGNVTYILANFGIIALDVAKREIIESYILNKPIRAIAPLGGYLYALAGDSVLRAAASDNLINPASWHPWTPPLPDGAIGTIGDMTVFNGSLCLSIDGKGIYYMEGNAFRVLTDNTAIRGMKATTDRLLAFTPSELLIYSSFTSVEKGTIAGITDASSLKNDNTFWLAAGTNGLYGIRRTAANQYENILSDVKINGPKRNLNDYMGMAGQILYVAGGGRWADRYNRPFTVMMYDTETLNWTSLPDAANGRDATAVAIDPADASHIFVSSWGEGVFEYKDGRQVNRYNHTNSALATIFPGAASQNNYVRVGGLDFDAAGNLWMTNAGVSNTIVVRKADGTWTSHAYTAISNADMPDKILVAGNGFKWINLARANRAGIFVLDDRNTIDDVSDDVSHYYATLTDNYGNGIDAGEFLCLSEDMEGNIWIGTNRGPVIVTVPSRGPEGTMTCSRIVHTDEYGSQYYFLPDERITAIAVDGGNRKWLGTGSSGLYLVNTDGSAVIRHYTASNSPLPSDVIRSLSVDNRTGEVFIGTDKGIVSYMSDAAAGADTYSNVYAYPNPVRPDYDGAVIVTGLMDNSNVKITNSRGLLVYEGTSNGGMFTWNCRTKSGGTVAPGIYFVLAATPEGKESVVTKIAVVR